MGLLDGLWTEMKKDGLSRIDIFFATKELQQLGLDYDDVTVRSGRSGKLLPATITLGTRFSRNIPLRTPFVSAAMDTVTEDEMAIALAIAGGIGVIHRNLSPELQAEHVDRVKFSLNGLIVHPKCIRDPNWTIEQVLQWHEKKGYRFHTFPVVDGENKLVGLLTGNDIRFAKDREKTVTVSEMMERTVYFAPTGTTKKEALALMRKHKKKKLPLLGADGVLAGMFTLKDLERIDEIEKGRASHNTDSEDQLRVAAAIGVGDEAFARAELLAAHRVDAFVIDTAHAWTDAAVEMVEKLKRCFPETDVVVGNVTEPGAAEELIHAGADGIKVGQGSGSICITTVVTGVGRTQLTAVYECARAARKYDVPVCADGGVKHQDDIVKALAAGAESVMMGNLLAGHNEAPGDIIEVNGVKHKIYRGMGSEGAIKQNLDRYHQGGKALGDTVLAEGVTGKVLYKGPVARTVGDLLAGVQSGMSAIGAARLADLRAKARFEQRTPAGAAKAHPHSITM